MQNEHPETPTAPPPTDACPRCGEHHERCPGCGKHPDNVAETQPQNAPPGAAAPMPKFTALYCQACGFWILRPDAEPARFLIREVPTLDPWTAFFMGIQLARVEDPPPSRARSLLDVLRALAADPVRGDKASPPPEPPGPTPPPDGPSAPAPETTPAP